MCSSASGPLTAFERGRYRPPTRTTSTRRPRASWIAPTLWVTMRASSEGSMWRMTCAAVVPELRKMVSPGSMRAAAATAMRRFSSALALSRST